MGVDAEVSKGYLSEECSFTLSSTIFEQLFELRVGQTHVDDKFHCFHLKVRDARAREGYQ